MTEKKMKKKYSDVTIWKKMTAKFNAETIGLNSEEWKDFCTRIEKLIHSSIDAREKKRFTMHIDGAARNNPGPAGIGVVVVAESGKTIKEYQEFIGEETNNVAEYRAFLKALDIAAELGAAQLIVHTDSELLANQMNGRYRVKNINLLNLYFSAQEKMTQFDQVVVEQVPREKNRRADMLANMAIDAKELAE